MTFQWLAILLLLICILVISSKLKQIERQDSVDLNALLDEIEMLQARCKHIQQRVYKLEQNKKK